MIYTLNCIPICAPLLFETPTSKFESLAEIELKIYERQAIQNKIIIDYFRLEDLSGDNLTEKQKSKILYDTTSPIGQKALARLSNEYCSTYFDEILMEWFVTICAVILIISEIVLAFMYKENLRKQELNYEIRGGWSGDSAVRICRINIKRIVEQILRLIGIQIMTYAKFIFMILTCQIKIWDPKQNYKIELENISNKISENRHSNFITHVAEQTKSGRISITRVVEDPMTGKISRMSLNQSQVQNLQTQTAQRANTSLYAPSSNRMNNNDKIGNHQSLILYFIRKLFCSSVTFEIISQFLDIAYIGSVQSVVNIMGDCENFHVAKHLTRSAFFYNMYLGTAPKA